MDTSEENSESGGEQDKNIRLHRGVPFRTIKPHKNIALSMKTVYNKK